MPADEILPVGSFVIIGGPLDSKSDRPEEVQGGGLTQDQVTELINVSVAAIYERAFNAALDEVLLVLEEGLEPEELIQRLGTLRKKCLDSSLQRQ